MDPIEDINIPQIMVPQIYGRGWLYMIPSVPNNDPPVTLQLGFPIVELPGCVEAHQDNKIGANRLPLDRDLVNDDPDGVTILCPNGEYPSYDAMNFEGVQSIPTTTTSPPPIPPPSPEIPDTGNVVPQEDKVSCPGPNQLRVGDITQSGDERVIGHRLIDNGKTCETLYEPTTAIEKYVPPINQITSVSALAVVATAGAAATPLLIRVIKPLIKKIWTTVQKKLGKGKKKDKLTSDQILKKNGMKKLRITD